jgi:post-segregation antitoxin (ccd killing protein)
VEKFFKRKVDKIILVAVNVDREAYKRAIDLGIDVVCGNVIDF